MSDELKVIRVKKLKLNPDRRTAKVVLDCMYCGEICKITIPKLDISSITLDMDTWAEQVYESYILPRTLRANCIARMMVEKDDNHKWYTIKASKK